MNSEPYPPTGDALYLATRGAPAARLYLTAVQSWLRDIRATLDNGDWPTCVEACAMALLSILHCRLVLAGMDPQTYPGELDVHAALDDTPHTVLLRRMPPSHQAGQADAEEASVLVGQAVDALKDDLPLAVPVLGSDQGVPDSEDAVYRVQRFLADLDDLRAHWNLPPLSG